MADLKISQLNSLAGSSLAATDELAVVDTSASETKKITSKDLVQYGYGLVNPSTLDGDIIEPGTTSARGTVQLTNSTSSTSTTTAATPNAVKTAFDLANAALPKAGGTMTGQILGDDSTSASTPGYAFDGDPDTGLLRTGANELGLVTGGTSRLTIDASGNVVIPGNFTVQGTTTTIDTTTLVVKDKNIEMGVVTTPTDVTADGGGITLKGTTDKTINWIDATDAWTSSERFSIPLGTAAAPSLTFTGDPNTGIYSPGADQLAISTNGAQRLNIDANGNTHVIAVDGQLSLSRSGLRQYQFRVTGVGSTEGLAIRDESGATEIARFTQNGYFTVGGLRIKGSDTQNSIYQSAAFGISSDNYITVGTGASQTERLRITSAGLVGVGTGSPPALLSVHGTGPQLNLYGSSTGSLGANFHYNGATGNLGIATNGVNASTNPQLLLDLNGRLGVGTTSPGTTLDVTGITRTSTYFSANDNGYIRGDTAGELRIQPGTNGTIFRNSSNSAEYARIDSSGRLLVGTSTSTASGDAVIQAKDTQVIGRTAIAVANNGTTTATLTTGGGAYQGFLVVSVCNSLNATVSTSTTYSIFGRGTTSTITQIATANGVGGARSFTVTTPTGGVVTVTNTAGSNSDIFVSYFGGLGG